MRIQQVEVREASASADDWTPVDVREAHEFEGPLGHLPGARAHPLGGVPASLQATPRDARLLLVCRSGKRSQHACELLAEQGFTNVANLAGGMIAWNLAGLPAERSPFASAVAVAENWIAYLGHVTPAAPEVVRRSLADLLEQAGSSLDAPSVAALEWALQELAESAAHPSPPADLELVLSAYRRDLAVL